MVCVNIKRKYFFEVDFLVFESGYYDQQFFIIYVVVLLCWKYFF